MDFIVVVLWLILGTGLFVVVNKSGSITYFGVSSIFGLWFGCMATVAIAGFIAIILLSSLITSVVDFVSAHYKWIIGIVVALVALGIFGSNCDNKSGKVEQDAEQEK